MIWFICENRFPDWPVNFNDIKKGWDDNYDEAYCNVQISRRRDSRCTSAAREAFKTGIEALPSTISFIRSVHVGFNINPAEKWDICLDSTFDNLDDVKAYSVHPAHKAVAGELMKHIGERACVDFEL